MKQLNIKVDGKGKVTAEVEGVMGSSCQGVTEELLKKLGGKVSEEYKPEFFMTPQEEKNMEFN